MLSLVILFAAQSRVLNYEITRDGKPLGTAKVLIKITVDGGKRTDTKLTLTQGENKLDMHTTQVWAQSGRPILKIVQLFDAKGVETSRTRIDFRVTDLLINKSIDGKLSKLTVPIPAKAEIRDLPEFWFLRDVPVKGKAYKYWTFNATSLAWEETVSTYIGEQEIAGKAKSLKQQHIAQVVGKRKLDMFLDETGFPVNSVTNDGTKIVAKF